DYGEVVRYLTAAVALRPQSPGARLNLGNALSRKGEAVEAIACYRQAITLDPKYAMAHTNLGIALGRKGEVDEAIACYRRALELAPKDALARAGLARAERIAAARDRFAAFQNGSYTPASNEERLGLAEWCRIKKLYDTATGLYAAAFDADPKLADDPQ